MNMGQFFIHLLASSHPFMMGFLVFLGEK